MKGHSNVRNIIRESSESNGGLKNASDGQMPEEGVKAFAFVQEALRQNR